MGSYVLGFQEIESGKLMEVGGKGLNLGELSRIEQVSVPGGFCVTTQAYRKMFDAHAELSYLLNDLSHFTIQDSEQISHVSQRIRQIIERTSMDEEIHAAVVHYLNELGENHPYAVRSSATAEDLPTASFAGQQDTYLNIIGQEAILEHIKKCWASLFTDRAVTYRIQNRFDHRKVYLSVVIQRMIFPQASGILFTADPITSHRKIVSIDASFGLGEALVSGLVNADVYKVQDGKRVEKKISMKERAIYPIATGGTQEREIELNMQQQQVLSDKQILQLEQIGRKIETYFGYPQDIEWCIDHGQFYIVQSRPITTLYPVPVVKDGKPHIYMSIGHQQMMTEAFKPLGIAFFSALSEQFFAVEAGGRLFLDISSDMASMVGRKILLAVMKNNDPLTYSALVKLSKRKEFLRALPRGKRMINTKHDGLSLPTFIQMIKQYLRHNPEIIPKLIAKCDQSIHELQENIVQVSGEEVFRFIIEDQQELKRVMYDPQSFGVIMLGVYVANWLNKKMEKWLGEKNVADTLSQSVPHNVTSEMGLALLDVADVVREYPSVIEYFSHANDQTFFEDLSRLPGGQRVSEAFRAFLDIYGVRCPGEIDITSPRWYEKPTALISTIMGHIQNFEPHSRTIIFEQKRIEAEEFADHLIERLKRLPGGARKAKKTKKMIRILRNVIGYREYPKYGFIRRYAIYKQALLREATILLEKGIIQNQEDIYYLSFDELREVVRTNQLDYRIITKRKSAYEGYEKLTPPRIMTSDGEIISGEYSREHAPEGALIGLPVSSGVMEGRARIVLKMEEAQIEPGDILVTKFTDPSWTPLFVSIKGLVTEVGGQMTHGSVVAREYGLPAVVGVENATKLIKDGDMIRINGTDGYIEILASTK
ncbi:pyruvate, water dikinase [Seinonella peptonophila]|uniref:Rifampicin phosphotransferase n=1 Tax=Seinonella peptonophila TaxID=112248 RepID=A0A1M4X973_9BACL|nr:phosphoenolpyruvate synthase [Seinonella peptonophila]SHE89915.1 pyruvate, water dikinase [Seinonella peptonophila]